MPMFMASGKKKAVRDCAKLPPASSKQSTK